MSRGPVLEPHEIGTYLDAAGWLIEVLGCPELARAWGQPSAVARYCIGGMAVHAVQGGVVRLIQVLQEPEPADGHSVALVDFCGANRMAQPDDDDPLFAVLRASAEEVALEGQPGASGVVSERPVHSGGAAAHDPGEPCRFGRADCWWGGFLAGLPQDASPRSGGARRRPCSQRQRV
jgi:hypothetical protein